MLKKGMRWGCAGPWYWEFQNFDKDPNISQLRFLLKNEMNLAGLSLGALAKLTPAQLDAYKAFVAEHDIKVLTHVAWNSIDASDDENKRRTDEAVALLTRHHDLFKDTVVVTMSCAGQRFDRRIPLPQRLERLARNLAPLAKACYELGTPLAMENREDLYCSDLVELCQATPHLRIFLDTGNTYLIGERPLPAIEAAAPYVVGCHFKDHRVTSNPQILKFEIFGSPLGDGDVGLAQAWDILLRKTPNPRNLMMELEMIAPQGMNPLECMAQSLEFIKSLPDPA
jgi:sugar phosphate isomerase/epimerase